MVLEATIICIDNSEYMRNGDFSPSRYEAQQDACNLICGNKTRANVENSIGLVTTAGKNVEVCVSLTQDLGKILQGLHKVKIEGQTDIVSSLKVASLALRHRANKRQEQRIIVFIGSPITSQEAELKRLGGQLKKNKIAVDIINFGEGSAEENRSMLESFIESVNNHDNSHIVTLPPGERMLSQMLSSTPIIRGDAPQANAADPEDDLGVDPNVDPELAMVMRLSLESHAAEQRARKNEGEAESGTQASSANPAPANNEDAMDIGSDDELNAAIALSLKTAEEDKIRQENEKKEKNEKEEKPQSNNVVNMEDDEDDELAQALKLSQIQSDQLKEKNLSESKESSNATPSNLPVIEGVDPDFMASVLLNLPGVDPNDPEVQAMIKEMSSQSKEKKDEK